MSTLNPYANTRHLLRQLISNARREKTMARSPGPHCWDDQLDKTREQIRKAWPLRHLGNWRDFKERLRDRDRRRADILFLLDLLKRNGVIP